MQNETISQVSPQKTVLLFGASRGLGFAMAQAYLRRGWHVIATARQGSSGALDALVDSLGAAVGGALEVETVDIAIPAQVTALRERLAGRRVDLLFVNAGVKNDDRETIADV